ncbi:PIG-L family deacetylase [Pseudoxanthomonas sp. JBR18]|uniref:PIG-L deacetylase family protein n=1 Tax=Pseudoxanthomonas sp. JBR18 TaxID=2969308 RepID=UPI0023065DA4|nr:PIG-L family deacetylase [Pseudoxanthomonas sp. JBR18]WCE03871.1 PIG-L family deacetylase [Pseudoxanthomonas sp. JBR18]
MDALRGQEIHGEGTPESAWLGAPAIAAMPTVTVEALLGASQRLVVVAPHPDDEILGCGGLLAAACEMGHEVLLISLTDGEGAYPTDPAWPPARLAPARRQELVSAAGRLGATPRNVVHAGFDDGRLRDHERQVQDWLHARLRPGDLVCVTWHRDGHPDHEAAAEAALAAAGARGLPVLQYPIWAWHWGDPDVFQGRATRLELAPSWQARKRAAIDCFATQLGTSTPPPAAPILPPHVTARFQRTFEVFLP